MRESGNKILKRFPKFFKDREFTYNGKTHISPFSMSIGWGWHGILRRLCENIERELDKLPEDEQTFQVLQVKEKFGGLRFYFSFKTKNKDLYNRINNYVEEAEQKSIRTCEKCGLPGKVRRNLGWYKCMCLLHYNMERLLRRVLCAYYANYWRTRYRKMIRMIKEVFKWQK